MTPNPEEDPMIETFTDTVHTDPDTLARWWVQLNAWVWPQDLLYPPAAPVSETEWRRAIGGAFAVVNVLADSELVTQLWQSDERQRLIDSGMARPTRESVAP